MKLKPYAAAILQSEKDETAQLAPARAAETQAALGMKRAQLTIEISKKETAVTQASARYPLDFNSLVVLLDEAALLRRSLGQLDEVAAQLFPATA